jgi:uncharacterized membrane protein YuzA (DUF378 family)
MLNLMPLAHGTLGSLDEIAAVVVGLAAALFVVLGFISRKREERTQSGQPGAPQVSNQPDTPDHYRLD